MQERAQDLAAWTLKLTLCIVELIEGYCRIHEGYEVSAPLPNFLFTPSVIYSIPRHTALRVLPHTTFEFDTLQRTWQLLGQPVQMP